MLHSPDGTVLLRIVFFGPPEAGKATILRELQKLANGQQLIPLDLDGKERGLELRIPTTEVMDGKPVAFSVAVISGNSIYATSRQSLLANVDGLVFVADSSREAIDANIESLNEMYEFLQTAPGVTGDTPVMVVYNKSDLAAIIPPGQLNPLLNHRNEPHFCTVATTGQGLSEAWQTISRKVQEKIFAGRSTTAQPEQRPAGQPATCLLFCHQCDAVLEVPKADRGEIFLCGSCKADIEVVDPERGITRPPGAAVSDTTMPQDGKRSHSDTYHLQDPGGRIQQDQGLEIRKDGAAVPPAKPTQPFILGGYELVENLDECLLGNRYLVREQTTASLKRAFIPSSALMAQPNYQQSLDATVRTAAKIRHPHLLPVLGLHWHDRSAVLLSHQPTDFEPLNQVLARRRILQPQQALNIIHQCALALEEAARHGVLHGYVRPECILINANGQVLLDDLALPKPHTYLLQHGKGATSLTEYYLAPEHARTDTPSDVRTDIFLLGAILHRLIGGSGLITGYTAVEGLNQFGARSHKQLGWDVLPKSIQFVLQRLTAIERRDRFQNYGEVFATIEPLLGQQRVSGAHTGGTRGGRRTGTQTGQGRSTGRRTGSIQRTTGSINRTTGSINRTTGSINRTTGSINRTGSHVHHPSGKGGGSMLLPLLLIFILVGAGTGIVYMISKQTTTSTTSEITKKKLPSTRETPPDRIPGDPATNLNNTTVVPTPPNGVTPNLSTKLLEAARTKIAAYQANPADEEAYQAALAAVKGLDNAAVDSQPRQYETQRLAQLRRDYLNKAENTTVPVGDGPPTREEMLTGDIQHFNTLCSKGQYEAARAFLKRFSQDDQRVKARREMIEQEIPRARLEIETLASKSRSRQELKNILARLDTWDLEGTTAWAQELEERYSKNLPDTMAVVIPPEDPVIPSDTHVVTPLVTPDNPPPEVEPGTLPVVIDKDTVIYTYTRYAVTPSGFKQTSLTVAQSLNRAMLKNVNEEDFVAVLGKLDPTAIIRPALDLQCELWKERSGLINKAAKDPDVRLRVVNPADPNGPRWSVTNASQYKVTVADAGGGSMDLGWHEIKPVDLAELFKSASKAATVTARDQAIAVVGLMVAGNTPEATLMSRQAIRAGFKPAEPLEQLIQVVRDQETLQLFDEAAKALSEYAVADIESIISKLELPYRAEQPQVQERLKHLRGALEAIKGGMKVAVVIKQEAGDGTVEVAPAIMSRDKLIFSRSDDRLSFTTRKGSWEIADGMITSSGDSCVLRRTDCATAATAEVKFQFKGITGVFAIDFRGARLTVDLNAKEVRVESRGATPVITPLAWAPNTAYTVGFSAADNGAFMVTLNKQPIAIPVMRPTDDFEIVTDTGAVLSIDEISITRKGGDVKPDTATTTTDKNALAALGLVAIGNTKSGDGTTIILPSTAKERCGFAMPLPDPTLGKLRFQVQSNGGILMIRLGKPGDTVQDGAYQQFMLPSQTAGAMTIDLSWTGELYSINRKVGAKPPVFTEDSTPKGATHLIIMTTKEATLPAIPAAPKE